MFSLALIFKVAAYVLVSMSVIPLVRNDYWVFRVFEYPRFQKFILAIIIFTGLIYTTEDFRAAEALLIIILLGATICYLLYQTFPFMQLAKKQVLRVSTEKPDEQLTLVTANVYQDNRDVASTLRIVTSNKPDLILLLEADTWWMNAVDELKTEYPYCVEKPLSNTYGMLLYSRLPLSECAVKFLVEDDIPSIHAIVELPSGQLVQLYCVHPTPPVPDENPRSTERDKELLMIAKLARNNKLPVIVMGDLNDVAWSYTTELFSKISGLLDPRKGRGFYNTFHARYPMLRFPLDHIFCSVHFKLVKMNRLPAGGSDHFPMYAKFQYEKDAVIEQHEPQPDEEDVDLANEKIKKTG